ncbi:hypothetical protein PCC79_08085 [Propioniciclava soli]|uniref:Uncharacterized protein n=1 Tax=Propioniciclava soli TaxID=2775081 RepID=A0ABZ3CF55_9ACTN
MNTRHIAEVTDPLTDAVVVLTAGTSAELEQLVDHHLSSTFPEPSEDLLDVTGVHLFSVNERTPDDHEPHPRNPDAG